MFSGLVVSDQSHGTQAGMPVSVHGRAGTLCHGRRVAWATGIRQQAHNLLSRVVGESVLVEGKLHNFGDSSAAIAIVRKRGAGRRTRHVHLRVFNLQDLVRLGWVAVHKIATAEQRADMLTKVKEWQDHERVRVGLKEIPGN